MGIADSDANVDADHSVLRLGVALTTANDEQQHKEAKTKAERQQKQHFRRPWHPLELCAICEPQNA